MEQDCKSCSTHSCSTHSCSTHSCPNTPAHKDSVSRISTPPKGATSSQPILGDKRHEATSILARLSLIANPYIQGKSFYPLMIANPTQLKQQEQTKNTHYPAAIRCCMGNGCYNIIRCYQISQPMAEAPSTAALAPSSELMRN